MCYGEKIYGFVRTKQVGAGALLFLKNPQRIYQLKNRKNYKDQSKPIITFSWLFLN